MKKLYSTQNWAKAVSLGTAMAALLSSVSPVFAAGVSTTGGIIRNSSGTDVPYPYGSHGSIVFAGDDDFCGVDNVVGRGGKQQEGIANGARITAEQQYERFIKGYSAPNGSNPYGTTTEKVTWTSDGNLINKASYMGTATGGIANALPEAYGVYSFVTGCGASATGNYSTAFGAGATTKAGGAQAFGVSALASGKASVAMGVGSEASGESAVALGGLALASGLNAVALGVRTKAIERYTVAIGFQAEARASGAIAIGGSEPVEDDEQDRFVIAYEKDAIAIGSHANAEKMYSIAIGSNALVRVKDGVAIGGGSVSLTEKGVLGYDPATNKSSTDNGVTWKSTAGAFSIGEVGGEDGKGALTRQITGVAAGTNDTDAVNVAQLKALRNLAAGAWKVSANDTDPTDVNPGNTVDFSVKIINQKGKDNLKIEKSTVDNKHKIEFTLNDHLKLTKVTTGQSSMSDDGFFINDINGPHMTVDGFFINDDNGPSITLDGIDAGNEKIIKVADGTDNTDAVNVAQLNEVKGLISKAGGWKLSVNGGDATDVNTGSTVKLLGVNAEDGNEESKNIKITKGNNNEVQFDLNDIIRVKRVIAGKANVSDNGFVITGGPNMTTGGINAGNKQIKGVANGTLDNDAVNVSQLNEVKNQIAGNSLVKWDEEKQLITVGKDKDGTKINIANINNQNRVVSGVADGGLGEDSKDAINGSQINKISGDVAKYFGGDAAFANGAFVGPRYNLSTVSADGTVKQKTFEDVGSALTGLDANVKNVNKHIQYVGNKFDKFSQDALLWDDGKQAFVARHEKDGRKTESKITSLLNGDISEDSTDAINGSQIHSIGIETATYFGGNASFENGVFKRPRYNLTIIDSNSEVKQKEYNDVGSALSGLDTNIRNVNHHFVNAMNDIATYFGGGAGYDENGEWKAPTFQIYHINDNGNVSKRPYQNVADAFEGVNTSFAKIHNQISNITENSLVKQDGEDGLITVGKTTGGTKISIANSNGSDRTISGVKAAELKENSTEAVNGSQLFTTNQTVSNLINTLNDVHENISNYFGGGANVLDGLAPTYVISGETYRDVGSAFTGVNISIKNLDDKIIEMKENNLVQQEGGASGVITIGAKTAGTKISVAGVGGLGRTISGVKAAENGDEAVNKDQLDKSIKGISKDALLWSEDEQAFVALHEKDGKKTKSKLKSLLDGDISKGSTDAITGNQLYLMSNKLAAYFGGGAKYENGKWTAPSFEIVQVDANGRIVKNSYNTVAEAFDGINSGMSNINNRIDDVINKVDSDALKWNKDKNAYDAGRNGQPSKIINVADGKIAEGSKDAVNGGQLWKTNERVAKVENRVTDVENHVKIIDKKVDNISNTIADIGDTVINIENKVDTIDNKVNNIAEDAVRYDRDEKGQKTNKITLKGGNPSEPVMIDNVADGKIEKGSKEAVNGGQLHDYTKEQMKIVLDESKHYTDQRVNNIVIDAIDDAVERANNYTNMKFEALNYSIENVRKEARQAAAIGLAVSNLRYNDTPGKLSVGFGSGLWRSQSAFAFGAGYTSESGSIRSNLSITTSGGHWGIGAGFNMTLN
ncbi:Vomp family autotransporter [Bartonella henselae]|uniref:Vomp family autotransporter n=1 Tax=Bartonella henselae TaxID=38323 RepID=UPI0025AAEB4C|nr:Vomp family autotransporter [Bartonella henselae]MDM9986555.1 Vomp family autotransporter [Bartonella henselae]